VPIAGQILPALSGSEIDGDACWKLAFIISTPPIIEPENEASYRNYRLAVDYQKNGFGRSGLTAFWIGFGFPRSPRSFCHLA